MIRWNAIVLAACALMAALVRAEPATAVRVVQPTTNAVLGAAEVSVAAVYEGDLVLVSCNDREGVVFGEKFVVEDVPLVEGQNQLLVKTTDVGGRASEAALDLVWDLTASRVKLVEPRAGAVLGVFRNRSPAQREIATPTSTMFANDRSTDSDLDHIWAGQVRRAIRSRHRQETAIGSPRNSAQQNPGVFPFEIGAG